MIRSDDGQCVFHRAEVNLKYWILYCAWANGRRLEQLVPTSHLGYKEVLSSIMDLPIGLTKCLSRIRRQIFRAANFASQKYLGRYFTHFLRITALVLESPLAKGQAAAIAEIATLPHYHDRHRHRAYFTEALEKCFTNVGTKFQLS